MNSQRIALILLMVFAPAGLFSACSAKGGASGGGMAYSLARAAGAYDTAAAQKHAPLPAASIPERVGEARVEAGGAPETPVDSTAGTARVLIRNAELRIRVSSLEAAEKTLAEALEQHKGYAAYSNVYDNSRHYTLKVPPESYDSVLTGLSGMGKVLSRSERVEDATIQFYDLTGRLETKEKLLKTFQSYLGQAKTIDEIMTVEKRIAELQQEIDWTGSQLSALTHLVDYATIDLELLGPLADTPSSRPGMRERVGELFRSFGDYASIVLVALMGAVIYGVPSLAVLFFLLWLLFGRIGILRKAWRLVMKRQDGHREFIS
ncbi:MAG: DUF4349 domain-containing protein [Treponema sp.]|jgi:hypothetical protein|nr:DUF4349 domain-containing protein [Treponema sp.]